MANLSQQDIDVRLQLAGCAYATLAEEFRKDLIYGKKCTVKDKLNLALLNIYIEMLECYNFLNETEVLSTGELTITSVFDGNILTFYVGGIPITGAINISSSSVPDATTAIVNAINSYSDSYTAVSPGSGRVTITGPCTNEELTYTFTVGVFAAPVITGSGMTGGTCVVTEENNCVTEEEIQEIIEKISKLTDICFQAIGFNYTES